MANVMVNVPWRGLPGAPVRTPEKLVSRDTIPDTLEVNDSGVEAGTATAFRLQVGSPASRSTATRLVESTHNLLNTKTGDAASEEIFA